MFGPLSDGQMEDLEISHTPKALVGLYRVRRMAVQPRGRLKGSHRHAMLRSDRYVAEGDIVTGQCLERS